MTDSLEMNDKLFRVVATIRKQLADKSGLKPQEQLLVTGYLFSMVLLEMEGDEDHPRDTFCAGMDLVNNALFELEELSEEQEGEEDEGTPSGVSTLPSST